jgi:hypothetical protein
VSVFYFRLVDFDESRVACGNRQEQNGPTRLHRSMEKAVAYLISVGIIGFGFWIIFASVAGSSWPMWLAGSVPIAVGLLSISNEIHNTG